MPELCPNDFPIHYVMCTCSYFLLHSTSKLHLLVGLRNISTLFSSIQTMLEKYSKKSVLIVKACKLKFGKYKGCRKSLEEDDEQYWG